MNGMQEEELMEWDLPMKSSDVPEVILAGIIYRMSNTWAVYKKPIGGINQDDVIYKTLLNCGFNSTGIVESKKWVPSKDKYSEKHFSLVQDMTIAFPMQ